MWSRIYAWLDEHGDITRDAAAKLVFEGGRVKQRQRKPTTAKLE